jgi:hypothetical protein
MISAAADFLSSNGQYVVKQVASPAHIAFYVRSISIILVGKEIDKGRVAGFSS